MRADVRLWHGARTLVLRRLGLPPCHRPWRGACSLTLRLETSFRLGFEGVRAAARITRLRKSERAFVAPPVAPATAPRRPASTRRSAGRTSTSDHSAALGERRFIPGPPLAGAPPSQRSDPQGAHPRAERRDRGVPDDLPSATSRWPPELGPAVLVRPRVRRAIRALYALGFAWEADDFLSFLVETTLTDRPLQNFVRVTGDDAPEEIELAHLTGHYGARPVRAGNAAARYAQHDVPGALLDAAVVPALARRPLANSVWRLVRREVENVVERWGEPDQGIWSLRAAPQHYTTSKVMCWVAVDRGAWLADLRGRSEQAHEWRATRDEIAADVLTRGMGTQGTFKEHYDSDELDASLLIIALVGFLPPDDERVRRTVLMIERELSAGGRARRRTRRGEPIVGEAVTVCSWWLVAALTTIGELDRARGLAERLLAYGGRLGLYAEHIDPHSGRQLGNFPHALTHLALIDALLRLMRADARP